MYTKRHCNNTTRSTCNANMILLIMFKMLLNIIGGKGAISNINYYYCYYYYYYDITNNVIVIFFMHFLLSPGWHDRSAVRVDDGPVQRTGSHHRLPRVSPTGTATGQLLTTFTLPNF